MKDSVHDFHGIRVFQWPPEGAPLRRESDANDIVGETYGREVDWIALPVTRLDAEFFRLRSGLAGAVLQKFITYGYKVALVGDITAHLAASPALGNFVRESNRGPSIWFVSSLEELSQRLEKQFKSASRPT